jgi:putative ABC transport system ATP-binding protein
MLECRNLTLKYKDGHKENLVLDNIDLKIENGKNVVVLGPSGSGKSSLIYLFSGLKKPTSGRIIIDGVDSSTMNEKQFAKIKRQKFGYIFQQHFLIPYLTVIENVMVGAPVNNKEYNESAHVLLKELGIEQYTKKRIFELSGGERQRVAIARALVSQPEVIFADEPTASLDHDNAMEIMKLLKEYKSSSTLLMATHDTSILSGDEDIIRIENKKVKQA